MNDIRLARLAALAGMSLSSHVISLTYKLHLFLIQIAFDRRKKILHTNNISCFRHLSTSLFIESVSLPQPNDLLRTDLYISLTACKSRPSLFLQSPERRRIQEEG